MGESEEEIDGESNAEIQMCWQDYPSAKLLDGVVLSTDHKHEGRRCHCQILSI